MRAFVIVAAFTVILFATMTAIEWIGDNFSWFLGPLTLIGIVAVLITTIVKTK